MPTSPVGRRPRVVCHTAASLDGRIVDGWPESVAIAVRRSMSPCTDGTRPAVGSTADLTMQPFARRTRSEAEAAREYSGTTAREDFRAPGDFDSFAFAIDASGRPAWEANDIDGDHVVAILSERVSDEYLGFLRVRGVLYVLAGKHDVDLQIALTKIGARFDVTTLMLEGGGTINGGMLAAGLIDEVSVLVAPMVDGRVGTRRSSTSKATEQCRADSFSSTWSNVRMACSGFATASSRRRKASDRVVRASSSRTLTWAVAKSCEGRGAVSDAVSPGILRHRY
jgi:2,5-diamino-6-(ribosylamino)-4(3H)-pyrimidinone 5'-phosphate reductase